LPVRGATTATSDVTLM